MNLEIASSQLRLRSLVHGPYSFRQYCSSRRTVVELHAPEMADRAMMVADPDRAVQNPAMVIGTHETGLLTPGDAIADRAMVVRRPGPRGSKPGRSDRDPRFRVPERVVRVSNPAGAVSNPVVPVRGPSGRV